MNFLASIFNQIVTWMQQQQDFNDFNQFVSDFEEAWRLWGQQLLQYLLQQRIEQVEAGYSGARQRRSHTYHTPLGDVEIKRRAYLTPEGYRCLVDKVLHLPQDAWLPAVLELACALGLNEAFPNAVRLFERWTHVQVSEKTLANQVEKVGEFLQEQDFAQAAEEVAPIDSPLVQTIQGGKKEKPRVYVGVDGVMTPLNRKQGYKEALVGVVFWEHAHWRVSPKRNLIRHRDYMATLVRSRAEFQPQVYRLYTQVVAQKPHETVVLGDGAQWIWEMAEEYFPNCVQILDFYHVSEYVWAVGREAYAGEAEAQKHWVEEQLSLLKQSRWQEVVVHAEGLPRGQPKLDKSIQELVRYLQNNSSRIDYHFYLKQGLMIGSGVVESSNRRVVTQRLKQSGMYWSERGAEGVMALRACYLSDSPRWQRFWEPSAA